MTVSLRLLGPVHFVAVRALLLPRLGVLGPDGSAGRAALPDLFFALPSVGPRAEAIVMARLGADWPLFADPASTIPSSYAQGDPTTARLLCDDALVNFTAMRVVGSGLLTQLVQTQIRTADQAVTYALDWGGIEACYRAEGYAALDLLRRAIAVPGRRFTSPTAGAAGGMDHRIRVPVPQLGRDDDTWPW